MYIQLNGQIICYEKSGAGSPVILLHGNQEDHEIFDELTSALCDSYTVYAMDTRGHGQSAVPREFHYSDMAEDVIHLIRALEIDHPIICGFSDGGIVALLTAIRSCDLVSALIVCGANLSPKGLKGRVLRKIRRHVKHSKNPLDQLMLQEPDISEYELSRITVPTVILAGEHDMVKPRETKRIASSIPNATLKILSGEDHGSYVVHSAKLAPYFAEITSLIS